MKWLINTRLLTAMIAAVLSLSLLAGSSHCALASLSRSHNHQADDSGCPNHPNPKGKESCPMQNCCASLKGTATDQHTLNDSIGAFLLSNDRFFVSLLILPEPPARIEARVDDKTGPPHFFAELILQHSLFENAPPAHRA